jgi:hypothetical protein
VLLGADNFMNQVLLYRHVWIKGRLRGGKSLLAVAIARELCRRGITQGVIANIPHGLPRHPWDELRPGGGPDDYWLAYGCCFIYDEPWLKLDNRTSMTNDRTYGAFIGKIGAVMLYPSVHPIDKRYSYLSVQRVYRFGLFVLKWPALALLGVASALERVKLTRGLGRLVGRVLGPLRAVTQDIWVYKWRVDMGDQEDTGTFTLVNPSEYYRLYDTEAKPVDDGDIGELLTRTILEDRKNDARPGSWWVKPGGPQEGPGEGTGAAAGTDSYYSPEVRSIAFPFFGRPDVQALDGTE